MDLQAKKKAMFRAKLNAQKKEKRIESPLVRYNEFDQPVCRVCDVVLKSESNWDAHQVSRKHREAISNLKASAAGLAQLSHAKPVTPKPEHSSESHSKMPQQSQALPKPQQSSALPPDFFDNNEARKQLPKPQPSSALPPNFFENNEARKQLPKPQPLSALPPNFFDNNEARDPRSEMDSVPSEEPDSDKRTGMSAKNQEKEKGKGTLPEGFFDNKEADLRARGIKPVKPDVKDEYKEFEKLIEEDLKEVDNRFEEEEIDAAEMIEEAESIQQKICKERVEMLRKRRLELKAAKSEKRSKSSEVLTKEPEHEESSSDDDSDGNFAVDWRAQHL
ncbi:hypothetical protein L6164_033065 [Bauhinia variegata]|uniref:Uncharacterized protein n=1 Tax=Bauhinia variegata TaxID=167791 RepID=A0ACB9KQR4_BAUVA|nr:hypothetical protein L6164_033065 [Bauhinia variegata]